MKIQHTSINSVIIIQPKIFNDSRGYFFESFSQHKFNDLTGLNLNFIQDNEAKSSYGVLRGLHFQKGEYAQAKLVRVVQGSVLDVAVDLRKDSATYGNHVAAELTEENKRQLFVPRGFAHGYVVLKNDTVFCYKVDNIYAPEHDSGIIYNDPDLAIDWRIPESDIKLSDKDKLLQRFRAFDKQ